MRWLDGITDLMDVSLSELREKVMNSDAWHAVIQLSLKLKLLVNFRLSIPIDTLPEFPLRNLLLNHQIKAFTYYGNRNVISHCLISGT